MVEQALSVPCYRNLMSSSMIEAVPAQLPTRTDHPQLSVSREHVINIGQHRHLCAYAQPPATSSPPHKASSCRQQREVPLQPSALHETIDSSVVRWSGHPLRPDRATTIPQAQRGNNLLRGPDLLSILRIAYNMPNPPSERPPSVPQESYRLPHCY